MLLLYSYDQKYNFKTYFTFSSFYIHILYTACDSGFYGNNCSSVCFLNCPNCRHTDGYCDYVTEFRGFNGSTGTIF